MRGGVEDDTSAEMQRIVTGPDPDRVRCMVVVDSGDATSDMVDLLL